MKRKKEKKTRTISNITADSYIRKAEKKSFTLALRLVLLVFATVGVAKGYSAGFTVIRSRLSMAAAAVVSSTSKTTKNLLSVRVVSYNVLSSHLAQPTHFHKCHPDHLDADYRLKKIFSKLQEEILVTSPIICLQEVSQLWAGKFHVFFAQHKYQMITGLYGKKFNGYMGIVLAYPSSIYDAIDVDIATLSDSREGGWPRPPIDEAEGKEGVEISTTNTVVKLFGYTRNVFRTWITSFIVSPINKLIGYNVQEKVRMNRSNSTAPRSNQIAPQKISVNYFYYLFFNTNTFHQSKEDTAQSTFDDWEYSENRKNVMIFARFREKHESSNDTINTSVSYISKSFCVSNYHMPCAYFAPKVMTIHSEMAAHRTQHLAGSDPFLLAGDFNIQPNSSAYRLLTTGILPPEDESFPTPSKYGMEWKAKLRPMRSAYAVSPHGEPEFTNYAFVGNMEQPFQETLDYIFLSEHWHAVDNVKETYRKDDPVLASSLSFPNADEPSDHLLIAATVHCEDSSRLEEEINP